MAFNSQRHLSAMFISPSAHRNPWHYQYHHDSARKIFFSPEEYMAALNELQNRRHHRAAFGESYFTSPFLQHPAHQNVPTNSDWQNMAVAPHDGAILRSSLDVTGSPLDVESPMDYTFDEVVENNHSSFGNNNHIMGTVWPDDQSDFFSEATSFTCLNDIGTWPDGLDVTTSIQGGGQQQQQQQQHTPMDLYSQASPFDGSSSQSPQAHLYSAVNDDIEFLVRGTADAQLQQHQQQLQLQQQDQQQQQLQRQHQEQLQQLQDHQQQWRQQLQQEQQELENQRMRQLEAQLFAINPDPWLRDTSRSAASSRENMFSLPSNSPLASLGSHGDLSSLASQADISAAAALGSMSDMACPEATNYTNPPPPPPATQILPPNSRINVDAASQGVKRDQVDDECEDGDEDDLPAPPPKPRKRLPNGPVRNTNSSSSSGSPSSLTSPYRKRAQSPAARRSNSPVSGRHTTCSNWTTGFKAVNASAVAAVAAASAAVSPRPVMVTRREPPAPAPAPAHPPSPVPAPVPVPAPSPVLAPVSALALSPPLQSLTSRTAKDDFLVQSRNSGMSYRDIKARGNFSEAESTLRGRYRMLTKSKEERVRNPIWTEVDERLLLKAVNEYSRGKDAQRVKLPWKDIAKYIVDNGGSYHFGNATCRKKWDELMEEEGK